MSIDTQTEKLLLLADAVRLPWLPEQVAYTTAYRWCVNGIGGVRLEHVRFGGKIATTERAMRDFFERLADPGATQGTTIPTPTQRKAAHAAATASLVAAGL